MPTRLAPALLLVAACNCIYAQSAPKIHRVGFVASTAAAFEPFRQGLRETGYIEGKNVVLEARFASARQERLSDLVAEVLRRDVAVLVVVSTRTALAAKSATSTVPIVFASVFDPLASGLVTSLARPGGNVTGTAMSVGGDFGGKWLELLKGAVPAMSRTAVLWNPANESSTQSTQAIRAAARALGIHVELFAAGDAATLDDALSAIAASHVQGLIIAPDPYFNASRTKLVRFAAKRRLPAVYFFKSFAEAGGLMSYGANNAESIRSAAKYVDRILNGAKPSDLPVDQPTRFDLVINLRTAKALGLKMPQALIVRADELIE
jgi:putative ABC transport system substrate-binding protein